MSGKKILFPKSNIAGDTLPDNFELWALKSMS